MVGLHLKAFPTEPRSCHKREAQAKVGQALLTRALNESPYVVALGDLNDFFHGWLNYQIEHHLWPDLSMLSYQKAAPLVRAICAKHGVPYVQHNVFWRLKKTVDIMTGGHWYFSDELKEWTASFPQFVLLSATFLWRQGSARRGLPRVAVAFVV